MRTFGLILLYTALVAAAFFIGASLRGSEPRRVTAADLTGNWRMLWIAQPYRHTFRPDGTCESIVSGGKWGYYGVWTMAKDGEVTVSEVCYDLPQFDQDGAEATFTLSVKRAVWAADRLARVELEGDYRGWPAKVVLTPWKDGEK